MTENDYSEGVKYLENAEPDHPILPTLKKGYTLLNVEYLKFAFRKKQGLHKPGELTKKNLAVKKAKLYSARAKLSNRFHECTSDAQRANISDQIREIQSAIAYVDQQALFVDQNPQDIVTPEFMDLEIPESISDKRKLKHILVTKARMSRQRAEKYKEEGRELLYLRNVQRAKKQEKQAKYVEQAIEKCQII